MKIKTKHKMIRLLSSLLFLVCFLPSIVFGQNLDLSDDEHFRQLQERNNRAAQEQEEFRNAIENQDQIRQIQGQSTNPSIQDIEEQNLREQLQNGIFENMINQTSRQTTPVPIGNNTLDQIINPSIFGGQPLNQLFNQLFYIGLVAAVILAIVMIIRGGIEYMTIDAIASKENGKKRVQAALGGLVLAFSAILILNTINPGLTSLSVVFPEIKRINSVGVDSGLGSGTRPDGTPLPAGNFGSWEEDATEDWILRQVDGVRGTDGRLNITTYSASGDSITDSNTAVRRGNRNNLLREGSVALSPDLISKYNPAHGSEIFINGLSVGFYEDTTASSFSGRPFRNTVDFYDENNTVGEHLKNIPAGEWDISFGNPRPQISNP